MSAESQRTGLSRFSLSECGPAGRRRRGGLGALRCLTLVGSVPAAELPAEDAAELVRLFARIDRDDTPGAVVAIARDGEPVFVRGYGMANLEHDVRLTAETRSETGSVAKQFTAAAVTLLAVRGKLSLDDRLKRFLPELPACADEVTLRQMLTHTSGLRDMHGLFDLLGRPTYAAPHENTELLEIMTRQRELNFPAGTEYAYSNTAFVLLTFVVERASGRPFAEFCRDEIFAPRGMIDTEWRTQFSKIIKGRASAYSLERGGTFRTDLPYSNIHGSGGLVTTVGDLLRWNASFDGATGEWAEVVRQMQEPGKLRDGTPIENGLGLRIGTYRGVPEVSHSGATAGYSTYLARFPSLGLSVAILSNLAGIDAGAQTYRIIDAIGGPELAPVVKPARVVLTPAQVQAHAGLYRSPQHDMLAQVTAVGDRLLINGAEAVPTGPHSFVGTVLGTKYEFDLVRDGRPRRLAFTSNRIARRYTAVLAAAPEKEKLADYVGDYRSPELDVTLPVTVQGGVLKIRIHPAPAQTAEPTFADGFWLGRAWHVTFTRDVGGRVDGLVATNALGRCRRVRFERLPGVVR